MAPFLCGSAAPSRTNSSVGVWAPAPCAASSGAPNIASIASPPAVAQVNLPSANQGSKASGLKERCRSCSKDRLDISGTPSLTPTFWRKPVASAASLKRNAVSVVCCFTWQPPASSGGCSSLLMLIDVKGLPSYCPQLPSYCSVLSCSASHSHGSTPTATIKLHCCSSWWHLPSPLHLRYRLQALVTLMFLLWRMKRTQVTSVVQRIKTWRLKPPEMKV